MELFADTHVSTCRRACGNHLKGMSSTKLTSEANNSPDFQDTPAFYGNRCSLPTLQKLLPSLHPEPDELNL
jgi:hypothetical protein